GLVDVTGAAARHGLEVDQLQADLRRERLRRRVELLRRERREAALVVRDLPHPSACGGSTPVCTSGAVTFVPASSANSLRPSACFAPMSWSIPFLIDSAPSFAIASRGSTPFGQRSLQK